MGRLWNRYIRWTMSLANRTGLEQKLNHAEISGELAVPEISSAARHMAAEGIVLLKSNSDSAVRMGISGACDYRLVDAEGSVFGIPQYPGRRLSHPRPGGRPDAWRNRRKKGSPCPGAACVSGGSGGCDAGGGTAVRAERGSFSCQAKEGAIEPFSRR